MKIKAIAYLSLLATLGVAFADTENNITKEKITKDIQVKVQTDTIESIETKKPALLSQTETLYDLGEHEEIIKLYESTLSDFKSYAQTISPALRKDIVDYRKAISDINQERKQTYKNASANLKEYLERLRKFKQEIIRLKNKGLNELEYTEYIKDYDILLTHFKHYINTLTPEVKDEIRNFRMKNQTLTNAKKDKYKQANQELQQYLKKLNALKQQAGRLKSLKTVQNSRIKSEDDNKLKK